jgi:hypothetical protein
MTPDRIAYLAGYFEARGSIVARTGTVKVRGSPRRMDGFGVSTAGPDSLIDALIQTFGGSRHTGRGWRCSSQSAARFLATILPHVRHRREEIEAALDFYRFMRAHELKGANRGVPSSITAERERLARRVADLREVRRGYGKRRRIGRELRGEAVESVA